MEEENMEEERNRIIPTFINKNMNTTTTQGVQKSLHVLRRSRRRCTEGGGGSKEKMLIKEVAMNDCAVEEKEKEEKEDEEEGSDDREEVERKIHALQRIVPNGESFGVDKLFDETAGYIVALQYQVKALKALTGFFEKLEKDKTKLGG
ncbi:hypothetical protein MtrunA17_Chr5g0443361 [Medicago truncatula]|uniref:Uncharacterized protein n=1 Tax=Medicago truncatula TaxID=3880 RepID=G7K3D0_MEDTR|nr:transcription factor PAR1 [Medicago truncatula]AET00408.2 hypothetical protein MTR_5g091690 [Medicago truncatula]RHN57708.1 hypothetical protein MtrunA17_Chr5g0443361 [Medicago truncatula]